jgi:hypothetical protein
MAMTKAPMAEMCNINDMDLHACDKASMVEL